jgi:hypothetical protein
MTDLEKNNEVKEIILNNNWIDVNDKLPEFRKNSKVWSINVNVWAKDQYDEGHLIECNMYNYKTNTWNGVNGLCIDDRLELTAKYWMTEESYYNMICPKNIKRI